MTKALKRQLNWENVTDLAKDMKFFQKEKGVTLKGARTDDLIPMNPKGS